jgi:hypothetical protein
MCLRRPMGCTAPRTTALSTHGRGQRTDSGCNRQRQDTVGGLPARRGSSGCWCSPRSCAANWRKTRAGKQRTTSALPPICAAAADICATACAALRARATQTLARVHRLHRQGHAPGSRRSRCICRSHSRSSCRYRRPANDRARRASEGSPGGADAVPPFPKPCCGFRALPPAACL